MHLKQKAAKSPHQHARGAPCAQRWLLITALPSGCASKAACPEDSQVFYTSPMGARTWPLRDWCFRARITPPCAFHPAPLDVKFPPWPLMATCGLRSPGNLDWAGYERPAGCRSGPPRPPQVPSGAALNSPRSSFQIRNKQGQSVFGTSIGAGLRVLFAI